MAPRAAVEARCNRSRVLSRAVPRSLVVDLASSSATNATVSSCGLTAASDDGAAVDSALSSLTGVKAFPHSGQNIARSSKSRIDAPHDGQRCEISGTIKKRYFVLCRYGFVLRN